MADLEIGKTETVTVWWIDYVNGYHYRTVKRVIRRCSDGRPVIRLWGGIVPVTLNKQGEIDGWLDDGWTAD